VMTHFGNAVPVWDVVNEPIDESQPDGYRRSPWFNILGPQYIPIALQAARAANPTAKLYINDFNTTIPAKRDFLVALARSLKSQGVPVDGIGHQMHSNIEFPSPQSLIDAVNLFDTTGVEQAVTEMDVSIYSGSFPTPFTSYTDIPQSRHVQVGYSYSGFVQALKQVSSKIVSITIWGTSDDKSWLQSSTKADAPLLFDESLQHKFGYWAFVDPLQIPGADLSTTLSASPATVAAGQAVAYAITVTNNADTNQQSFDPTDDDLPAANVSMTMAIPTHTGFQALTVPAGWTCSTPAVGAGGQVSCTVGTLGVGASAHFALTVGLNDCSTSNGLGIAASASVKSTTADPNPAPNNTASATIQASNAPPVITANGPLAVTVECATSYTDAGASAVDACDGPDPVSTSSDVNVGAVGSYAVTYTAADKAGDQAAPVVRTVNVTDTTPPVVTVLGPNPETVECATPFVDPGATAADSCVGSLPVAEAGAVNAGVPGSYSLGYTATDPSGNVGVAMRAVNVNDTTAPQLSVAAAPLVISSMNHKYVFFPVTSFATGATDTCDPTVGLGSVVITQVTSDEPNSSAGSGNTANDILIGGDCRSVQLRAERTGSGNGRVYTVTMRVTDVAGNSTSKSVQVFVPHSGSGSTAVDDGPASTVISACN
jgi:hypothetical protein